MAKMGALKMAMLNMRSSKPVQDELRVIAKSKKIDIILAQEPWKKGLPKGLGLSTRCIYKSSRSMAAVYVANPRLQVMTLPETCDDIACAKIEDGEEEIVVVSLYARGSINMSVYTGKLQEICLKYQRSRIIIGGDTNSHHVAWGDKMVDARGTQYLEFAMANGLVLLNSEESPITFSGPRGSSSIDVVAMSPDLFGRCGEFEIDLEATHSDHALISWIINHHSDRGKRGGCRKRVRTETIPDKLITTFVEGELAQEADILLWPAETEQEIDVKVQIIDDVMYSRVARLTEQGEPVDNMPWWSAEIAELKRASIKLRRKYHRTRDPGRRRILRQAYHRSKRKFHSTLRAAQRGSWRDFVEAEEDRRQAWGVPTKIATEKITQRPAVHPFLDGVDSFLDVGNALLGTAFPPDLTDGDTATQRALRASIQSLSKLTDHKPEPDRMSTSKVDS